MEALTLPPIAVSTKVRPLTPTNVGWSLIASLMAHVAILAVVTLVAYHVTRARDFREPKDLAPASVAVAVDLPTFSEGALFEDCDVVPEGAEPAAHGGAVVARVDTGDVGRGGHDTGPRATNLAAVDEGAALSPDLANHRDRDQHQRLKTSTARATRDDRRATTRPMELSFLATGKGERQERRPNAPLDPSRGSLVAPRPASVQGGDRGMRERLQPSNGGVVEDGSRPGQREASPGQGVRTGAPGTRHMQAASVAMGRPAVVEASPSIPAALRGRPHDTVDSDQEVARMVQRQVHASFAGGLLGEGAGGAEGPGGDRGAGGMAGRGSIARPLGSGEGDVFDWNTTDPRLLPYFRTIHAKVDPLWRDAFPKSAMRELRQGTVILEFAIAEDGSATVSWPPARPSGIDEFDRNCAEAIRRASPFDPLPAALRTKGKTRLVIRAPFVAKNPIVK